MINDISIYADTKRNEKCPCGSGKIFKKCCMKEYREAKKRLSRVSISSFSPIKPLTQFEKDKFTKFYTKLLVFSHQCQNGKTETIYTEDKKEFNIQFLSSQRPYFYNNKKEIIDKFIAENNPDKDEMTILEAIKDARFENFFLLSKSENYAVLLDTNEKLYNIQALNSPFTELFTSKSKYILLETVLIPYKDCYITDGIYSNAEVTKEIEEYLNKIPFKNPIVHYNKNNNYFAYPLIFNFTFACDINNFKKMEKIVLEKIPQSFSENIIKLIDDKYSHRKNIISSFLRSTDLINELGNIEENNTFSLIISGSSVTNFERGNKTDVIPYSILKKFYKQKPIETSISWESYEKNLKLGLSHDFSSFYTLLGIVHLDSDKLDDFIDYFQDFNKGKKRIELAKEVEKLFEKLSIEAGFKMYSVFLGADLDLECIYENIENYRKWLPSKMIINEKALKKYSYYGN